VATQRNDLAALLPAIDQVGFVVRSIDEALPRFRPLVGEFQVATYDLHGVDYRGRSADCTLKIGTARSGSIEIELIEVLGGDAIHSEFLAKGGSGPHHIRFPVGDLEAGIALLAPHGLRAVFRKRFAPGLAFAYLEDDEGRIIELFENRGT
jgi:catechol 2,3-dioxygenase-like lactoylglutathione lyase family enzyme